MAGVIAVMTISDPLAHLKAALDSDEAAAKQASNLEPENPVVFKSPDVSHSVRQDPKRILRVVAAHRKIIALYEDQAAKAAQNALEQDLAWMLWSVIECLATIYSDDPGSGG